jgi:DNA processing protein
MITQTINRAYYVLRLLSAQGIGLVKARQIMETCVSNNLSLDELFQRVDNDLLLPVTIAKYSDTLKNKDERLDDNWRKLSDNQINSVICDEKEYPRILLDALGDKSPLILYYKGDLTILNKPSVGFCGSRKASEKGLETASDCAGQLAREGANIVSGYAHGVDMATHCEALKSGGVTTLVLAEGILNFNLKKELSRVYDSRRVLIISEFLPGVPWSVRNAMQRNATICGLSNLMILIEAREKGGSFNAGEKCLAMGRPLFAPIYNGMPESANGNQILIEQGARRLQRNKKTGRAHMEEVKGLLFGGYSVNRFEPALGYYASR